MLLRKPASTDSHHRQTLGHLSVPAGPNREFEQSYGRIREDTLYLLTSDELLASTDRGKTWDVLGSRPEGRVVALVITDSCSKTQPPEC